MYKNRKPIIMAVLCVLIVVMAIGFALLSQNLTINGTSHIDSNWNIRITNIQVQETHSAYASGSNASADVSGNTGCTTQTASNNGCGTTTANFETKLVTPGDYVIYRVTITNSGTLDGVVESINLTCSENDAIICTTTGLAQAATIAKNGGINTVDVKVEYNSATTTQPANTSSTATLTINYQQDLGQVSPPAPTYDYTIEDTITYKGSTWHVIKNSPSSESYVTLMKETVLTNAELGTYAHYIGYDTARFDKTDPISNDYATSNVKNAVEAYATSKGMMNDLAEVAVGGTNYKIRLITKDELMTNLGYTEETIISAGKEKINYNRENVPAWVFTNYGENQNNVYGYWTMTPYAENASIVWIVFSDGSLGFTNSDDIRRGVRPVINLLKSNIPAQQ